MVCVSSRLASSRLTMKYYESARYHLQRPCGHYKVDLLCRDKRTVGFNTGRPPQSVVLYVHVDCLFRGSLRCLR